MPDGTSKQVKIRSVHLAFIELVINILVFTLNADKNS